MPKTVRSRRVFVKQPLVTDRVNIRNLIRNHPSTCSSFIRFDQLDYYSLIIVQLTVCFLIFLQGSRRVINSRCKCLDVSSSIQKQMFQKCLYQDFTYHSQFKQHVDKAVLLTSHLQQIIRCNYLRLNRSSKLVYHKYNNKTEYLRSYTQRE